MPHVPLARLEAWVERRPSRLFGGWDAEAIVEAGGGCEETAFGVGSEEEDEPKYGWAAICLV